MIQTTDKARATYIQSVLKAAKELNPLFLINCRIINAKAQITFDSNWGLGSSSTLLSNVAFWANVNPFELNSLVSKGSGYDIACARSQSPILYSMSGNQREIKPIVYSPSFSENMYFIYLGQKQATEASINNFFSDAIISNTDIYEISDLTYAFTACKSLYELVRIIEIHESLIGKVIGKEPLKSKQFSDFEGSVKSLGAWGGDFCLAVSANDDGYVKKYFQAKGLETVLKYGEMVLLSSD